MHYVYILQSVDHPDQFYTGLSNDVESRLASHNAGQSPHTSKYKPWRLLSCHWFERP
jgi:putative endonuclease